MAGKEGTVPKSQDRDCTLVTTTAPLNLSQLENQLFEWARSDRVDAIKTVIEEQKCDLNVQDNFNRTPLHFAASNGNFATVKLLVQARVVIDVTDKYGITPLMWAVYNNHKKVAVYLIESGAKYNRITKQGHTLIHFIAESNALGMLKYLYQKYRILKIDEEDNSGLTPFLVAAHRGNRLLMEVFVRQGCNVLHKDKRKRSALHLASWKGHTNVVAYLLSLEQILHIINDLDSEDKSALHLAVESNHQEVLKLLLGAKANADLHSDSRDCALIEASRNGFHSCIDTLLQYGADKDNRTKVGNSALHAAVLANLPETIYFLLSRGFDLHSCNARGQTPLHLAVEQNKLESVEALLLVGARIDIADNDRLNPLEVAARASYTAFVDMIIKADRWRKKHPDRADRMRCCLLSIPGVPSLRGTSLASEDTLQQPPVGGSYYLSDRPISPSSMWGGAEYSNQRGHEPSGAQSSVYECTPSAVTHSANRNLHTPVPGIHYVETRASDAEIANKEVLEFVDPYLMFAPPLDPIVNMDQVTPRSSTHQSASGSDELSLGFEASRIWESRRAIRNSSGNGRSQHRLQSRDSSPHDTTTDMERVSDERIMLGAYKESVLPNGEVMISLVDEDSLDGTVNASGAIESCTSEIGYFSFVTNNQPYAEVTNVILFELSHKYLKPDEWKKLAHYWDFEEKHIAAIEYQDSGKNAHKEHGYRLMSIWLHGVEPNVSPLNELYQALIGIGEHKLARKLRERVEMTKRKKKGCRVQ